MLVRIGSVMGIAVLAFFSSAVSATAAPPGVLWHTPESKISGSDAGSVLDPHGIGVDPDTGPGRRAHIYVAEFSGARISEFTTWGEFVKAWGWGVRDGSPELQTCTAATGCQGGSKGGGAGQMFDPVGVAVDAAGDIYVYEAANRRVQKFNAQGEFLLMWGGSVNKSTNAGICTKADIVNGDECGIGTSGAADGQFSTTVRGAYIAVGPAGTIFVGDKERIQEFDSDGTYKSEVKGGVLAGNTVEALAVDGSGHPYVALMGQDNVFKLLPATGAAVTTFPVKAFVTSSPNEPTYMSRSLAVDDSGNVYATHNPPGILKAGLEAEVLQFDAGGSVLIPAGSQFAAPPFDLSFFEIIELTGLAVNAIGNVYVSNRNGSVGGPGYISSYGPAPIEVEDPPLHPPEIKKQSAISVDTDSALVRAEINPHFWPDTTYYVEYGTSDCASGGCEEKVLAPGKTLGGKSIRAFLQAPALLTELQPGTTYHYRFVAVSGGGGPVSGEGEEERDRTFTTFPRPSGPNTNCSNQAFRVGASASLPDCRAYEMVSPLDKNNGDIWSLGKSAFFQSAADGGGFAYPSMTSFGGAQGAPLVNQHIAHRDPSDGWSSVPVSPARGLTITREGFPVLGGQFKAFSADLAKAWVWSDSSTALVPEAVEGFMNLYERDNITGVFKALTTVTPPNREPIKFFPELQGVSGNGEYVVFRAEDSLTPEAPDPGPGKSVLYGSSGGQLHIVSVLPTGVPTTLSASAGTANGQNISGTIQSVAGAVSENGSKVYWSATPLRDGGPGKLYLRKNPTQPQSKISGGKCTQPARACTVPVSETVSSGAARFWTASADGERALFSLGGDMYEFDASDEASTLRFGGLVGMVGASEDLSHVYFVSTNVLSGGEQNSEGDEAQPGGMNLYLMEDESVSFIATVTDADAAPGLELPSINNVKPSLRKSRVTVDGRHLAFMSAASLTDYDNTDAATGEPALEVFLYDANDARLLCVSCNPSGAIATGRVVGLQPPMAAEIPAWRTQFYASRALAESGDRLFFNSFEALVPGDTNGRKDVYQWEAVGSGDCVSEASPAFSASAGGCISLISTGGSASDSEFLDASPGGSDVFILTAASLVPSDYGLIDVYDARVEGGFASKPPPPPACEGEACQGPVAPPDDPVPASSTFQGAGNVKEGRPRRCAKGKVRRKGRCVAKKRGRRANVDRKRGSRR